MLPPSQYGDSDAKREVRPCWLACDADAYTGSDSGLPTNIYMLSQGEST